MSSQPFVITFSLTCAWWIGPSEFLGRLAGVTDPQHKRRIIIGHEFIEAFRQSRADQYRRRKDFSPRAPSTPTSSSPGTKTVIPRPISS